MSFYSGCVSPASGLGVEVWGVPPLRRVPAPRPAPRARSRDVTRHATEKSRCEVIFNENRIKDPRSHIYHAIGSGFGVSSSGLPPHRARRAWRSPPRAHPPCCPWVRPVFGVEDFRNKTFTVAAAHLKAKQGFTVVESGRERPRNSPEPSRSHCFV